jgi:hypothetical protein
MAKELTSKGIRKRIDQVQGILDKKTVKKDYGPEWVSFLQIRTQLEGNYLMAKLLEHFTVAGVDLPQEGRMFRDDET